MKVRSGASVAQGRPSAQSHVEFGIATFGYKSDACSRSAGVVESVRARARSAAAYLSVL